MKIYMVSLLHRATINKQYIYTTVHIFLKNLQQYQANDFNSEQAWLHCFTERKCAENYRQWNNKFFYKKTAIKN